MNMPNIYRNHMERSRFCRGLAKHIQPDDADWKRMADNGRCKNPRCGSTSLKLLAVAAQRINGKVRIAARYECLKCGDMFETLEPASSHTEEWYKVAGENGSGWSPIAGEVALV